MTLSPGIIAAIRNGAGRVINVTSGDQPYVSTKYWADMDETEFAKKAPAQMWNDLMNKDSPNSIFGDVYDYIFLFGLQQNGKQDYRQIFALKDIQKVFKAFIYRPDGTPKPAGNADGAVATATLYTIENRRRGIPAGRRVVLTIASIRPSSNWEKQVDSALQADSQKGGEFDSGRKVCEGKAGPWDYTKIFNFSTAGCTRLWLGLGAWTVLRNREDFDFEYDPHPEL